MRFTRFSRHGDTEPLRLSLLNIPLFVLCFLFLIAVLAWNSWQQYRQDQETHNSEVRLTLDNYARQAGLLAQAGIAANTMFVRGYSDLIEASLKGDHNSRDNLWSEMIHSFFNLTGYTVIDAEGNLLLQGGELLSPDEVAAIYVNVHLTGEDSGLFLLRYGNHGGYYFYTRFTTNRDKTYVFVSRRAYSQLSQIIYNGHFPGFEMVLLDNRNDSIIIREQYFADSNNPLFIEHAERNNIIYRTRIPFTHWDIIALPVNDGTNPALLRRLTPPLLVMITFFMLASILWIFMRRQERQASLQEAMRRQTEQRADRVLASIDDALISTDSNGVIDYVNPKGAALLIELGIRRFNGERLALVWPDEQALWNRGLSTEELEMLADTGRRMTITIGNETRVMEQQYSPLYERRKICGIVWLLRDVTDSELVVQAMQQSQQRYKALFEEAGVAHCVIDISRFHGDLKELSIIDVNDAAVHMAAARSREHLIGHFAELSLEPGKSQFAPALQRAIELELSTSEFDMQVRCFNGEVRDFWANISLHSGAGEHALVTLVDVTANKDATRQIREREAFWSSITDSLPDVIYVVKIDDEQRLTNIYNNRTIGEFLGYPPEQRKDNWADYATGEHREKILQLLTANRNMKPGETRQAQGTFIHYDGSIRVLKSQDTPFRFDEQGKVTHYIGSVRDVTIEIEKQQLIVESERRYRLLAENISDVIWATDLQLHFNFVSSSVERVLGYKQDELLNEGVKAIFQRDDIRSLVGRMQEMMKEAQENPQQARQNKAQLKVDIVARDKQGKEILVELQSTTLWNDKGELQGTLGICRDVSEVRAIERELQLAAEVFANSNEAIIITDNTMTIANANRAFCAITGYEFTEVIGRTPDFLVSGERHDIKFYETIGEALVVDGYWQGEIFYLCKDGETRTGWAGVSAIRDDNNEVQSLIIIMSDITERKVIEERIHRLAYFDPLTGLPNRTQMHERLDSMIRQAHRNDQCIALLFIDLDRFKPINDSMGHPAGDQVLKQVAQRLQECTKRSDLVCRMGGDEFTVALGEQLDENSAGNTSIKVAERILHALNQPYMLHQREVFISASIGISIFPHDGQSVLELLKNSDMAMYHAKNLGRDNVQFFDEKMNEKAVELMELENDLRQALSRNELELYYQPQYQARNEKVVAAEALLRWNHPRKGMISPATFIPIIEDTGLIVPIGEWVLSEACRQFVSCRKSHPQMERIAVNVSARQFKHSGFIHAVQQAIASAGILPQQLELELTESILMDDVAHTLDALKSLREIGVRTAIDDFGTGYSSLNYLKQFPVDILKIDRSFIQNLPQNQDDAQITRTIIAMAHNLGMGVIAEGVETAEQLEFLISADCEEVQGFLFSRPLPGEQLLALLSD